MPRVSPTTYYANVDRPGMGSSSATITLNADGTLGSTAAQGESKVGDVIAAGLGAAATLGTPFATALGGRFVYDSAVAAAEVTSKAIKGEPPPPPPIVHVALTATPVRRLYVIASIANRTSEKAPEDLCPKPGIDVSYGQRLESATPPPKAEEPKPAKKEKVGAGAKDQEE